MRFQAILSPVLGIFLLGMMGTATAQSEIAVVDFEKLILAHPKAKELETTLRNHGKNAASILIAEDSKLKNLKADVDMFRLKGISNLNESEMRKFEKAQQEALQVQTRILELDEKTRGEMQNIRSAGRKEIAAEVQALVKQVNNGRYALVFDLSFISNEGFPPLIDYPGATDITEEVMALLPTGG